VIGVYYSPESLTKAKYEEVGRKLQEGGPPSPDLKLHTCFGEEGSLSVFEIWETREAYDAAAATLLPILDEAGVKLSRPADVVPVVSLQTG
jgi:hypothetical protein